MHVHPPPPRNVGMMWKVSLLNQFFYHKTQVLKPEVKMSSLTKKIMLIKSRRVIFAKHGALMCDVKTSSKIWMSNVKGRHCIGQTSRIILNQSTKLVEISKGFFGIIRTILRVESLNLQRKLFFGRKWKLLYSHTKVLQQFYKFHNLKIVETIFLHKILQ
jgi:hypothetical protein